MYIWINIRIYIYIYMYTYIGLKTGFPLTQTCILAAVLCGIFYLYMNEVYVDKYINTNIYIYIYRP
jgi:glucose uptake protein GlcU